MTKRKPSSAQQAAEIDSLDLLPPDEARRRTDALLKGMLDSPPDPHVAKKSKAKPKKRTK